MAKELVVSPDLTLDWLEKYRGIKGELEAQLIRGLREPGKGLTLEQLQLVVEHRNPFEALRQETRVLSFSEALVVRAAELLSKKFGKKIEVGPLPTEFTEDNLAKWARFNLKPIFFPNEEIGKDRKLTGWVKPEKWFYDMIQEKRIAQDSAILYPGWYLADFTPGSDYTDGTQEFPDDPLAPIIRKLREEGKVGKYDNTPAGSRFTITNDEWRGIVCPAIAIELGFNPNRVRLERAIEFNTVGNIYDPNRGRFNMWEWFEDTFVDSRRLFGGHRRYGGLADIYYVDSDYRDDSIAGRSLVGFAK